LFLFTNFENMPLSPSHSKVSENDIRFFFQDVSVSLSERTRLKSFLQGLFKKEGRKLESLNYIFCTDSALLGINRQYLSHDYYTDIISFELSAKGVPVQGEIYISVDRVRDNAKTQGVPFKVELHRVIFHGALHLCGYKDKTSKDTNFMRLKEDEYLNAYFK
jgi:probable rRNA maturation factor